MAFVESEVGVELRAKKIRSSGCSRDMNKEKCQSIFSLTCCYKFRV